MFEGNGVRGNGAVGIGAGGNAKFGVGNLSMVPGLASSEKLAVSLMPLKSVGVATVLNIAGRPPISIDGSAPIKLMPLKSIRPVTPLDTAVPMATFTFIPFITPLAVTPSPYTVGSESEVSIVVSGGA